MRTPLLRALLRPASARLASTLFHGLAFLGFGPEPERFRFHGARPGENKRSRASVLFFALGRGLVAAPSGERRLGVGFRAEGNRGLTARLKPANLRFSSSTWSAEELRKPSPASPPQKYSASPPHAPGNARVRGRGYGHQRRPPRRRRRPTRLPPHFREAIEACLDRDYNDRLFKPDVPLTLALCDAI